MIQFKAWPIRDVQKGGGMYHFDIKVDHSESLSMNSPNQMTQGTVRHNFPACTEYIQCTVPTPSLCTMKEPRIKIKIA